VAFSEISFGLKGYSPLALDEPSSVDPSIPPFRRRATTCRRPDSPVFLYFCTALFAAPSMSCVGVISELPQLPRLNPLHFQRCVTVSTARMNRCMSLASLVPLSHKRPSSRHGEEAPPFERLVQHTATVLFSNSASCCLTFSSPPPASQRWMGHPFFPVLPPPCTPDKSPFIPSLFCRKYPYRSHNLIFSLTLLLGKHPASAVRILSTPLFFYEGGGSLPATFSSGNH